MRLGNQTGDAVAPETEKRRKKRVPGDELIEPGFLPPSPLSRRRGSVRATNGSCKLRATAVEIKAVRSRRSTAVIAKAG